MSRVIEHFPSWMTGEGIFSDMQGMPWSEEIPDGTILDIEYFGNHSGLRESSALLEKMTAFEGSSVISDTNRERLIAIIEAKYKAGWTKLWAAMFADYNPIENYRMEETATPDISYKHKVSADYKAKQRCHIIPKLNPRTSDLIQHQRFMGSIHQPV